MYSDRTNILRDCIGFQGTGAGRIYLLLPHIGACSPGVFVWLDQGRLRSYRALHDNFVYHRRTGTYRV